MKIYYTCSTAEFNKYEKYYFDNRIFLISSGHILTRDWLPHTAERLKQNQTDIRDIKQIYTECIKAIRDAELVIIEDTVSNFSTCHQITIALQLRKPTLVLWQVQKYRQFKQMFIHGIDSDILQISEYTNKDFQSIVKTFIAKHTNANESHRFHLVLNNFERQYLGWAQYKKGISRTKLIRKALKETIDNDFDYQSYLNQS